MTIDRGGESDKSPSAITDLVNERGYFLAQPSFRARAGWTIVGLVVIAITGFLGYPQKPAPFDLLTFVLGSTPHTGPQYSPENPTIDGPFMRPWLLYLWLGGLVMALQGMVLRHPSLRQQRRVVLTTTAICLVITALVYLYRTDIWDFFQNPPSHPSPELPSDPAFYAVANYLILLALCGESLWLIVRRRFGQGPSVLIDLKTGQSIPQAKSDLPSPKEQITGYLITRGLLLFLLALFMNLVVPQIVDKCHTHPLTIGGTCLPTDTWLPLWNLDMALAFVALAIGLVMLALIIDTYAQRRLAQRGVPFTYTAYGEEMVSTLLDTLFALFRGRSAATNSRATPRIPSSLRYLVWPILLLVATLGAAIVSLGLQAYLHSLKPYDDLSHYDVLRFLQFEMIPLGLGLLGGLLLIMGVALAMAVRLASWHVASDILRFLLRIGGALIVTFGIYSLALLVINQLVLLLIGCYASGPGSDIFGICGNPRSHPFNPGILTALSMLVVVVLFILLVRRRIAQR